MAIEVGADDEHVAWRAEVPSGSPESAKQDAKTVWPDEASSVPVILAVCGAGRDRSGSASRASLCSLMSVCE